MPASTVWDVQDDRAADDYQMLEELGSGSFGVVYKAIEKATGEFVAIKHIDLEGSDDDIREIQQEISLLATCASDYVTRYRASFVRGTKLWIVMEYLGGGSCLDLLRPGPMAEGYIAVIMRELLRGLDYLHSTGKIHRDIKAANILLSDHGQVKIADFGVAAQLTNIKSQRLTFVGTPFWMAPEVIQEAGYDYHADIWSLGITGMELALGEPPRSDIHPMKVLFLIPKELPPRLEGNKWSKDFKDFVALCLNKDADERPSAHALLKHAFIRRAGHTNMLQDLVQKARRFEEHADRRDRDTRFYEETLREINMASGDEDDWVFDTIKTSAGSVRPLAQHKQTVKRRKLERIPSGHAADMSDATHALEDLSLDAAPLRESTNSPSKNLSTIRTPVSKMGTQRRVSALTARKISSASQTSRRVSNQNSADVGTTRHVPTQPVRQPLGLDMSFGNSPSTVRQFRRVSSGGRTSPIDEPCISPQDSVFDSDEENKPPTAAIVMPIPPVAATKESMLGRRCFTKCIDPAFQEAHAATADRDKRNVLAQVGEAWSALDKLDPEGELALLKLIMDRVQADPKLASALLPQRLASTQLASLQISSPRKGSVVTPSQIGKRAATPQSSPTKGRRDSELPSSIAKKQGSPTKLVLNPQNPHLRKMRSSQQLKEQQNKEKAALDAKMPGNVQPGMEHVSMLSNVLYGRWSEGLRARWPLT